MRKNIRGKNILRKLFLGLLACLLLPACAGDEEEMQEIPPRNEDGKNHGEAVRRRNADGNRRETRPLS